MVVILLPPLIPAAIALMCHSLGIDTCDPFPHVGILAGLLPGTILISRARMNVVLKVIVSILYLSVGFPSLVTCAIIFDCVALGDNP
jgi:hypothetical protein